MKTRLKPLPHWALTDLHPAFYDVESVTAIEMVAKLYGKIEQLICDYNMYIDQLNKYVEEFEFGIINDFDEFKCCINKTIRDFIDSIDMKIDLQDEKISNKFNEIDSLINGQNEQITTQDEKIDNQDEIIAQAVNYMQENLSQTINNLFEYHFNNGDFTSTVGINYDEVNERLDISDTLIHAEEEQY